MQDPETMVGLEPQPVQTLLGPNNGGCGKRGLEGQVREA